MTEVKGIELPGVGVRYEFLTEEGKLVGVVSHRSGRREIYIADRDDPDRFERVLGLSEQDARTLSEVLGASRVAEELAELHQKIEGLAIDWLPVREDTPFAHRTIGDARVRTRTGVSVVAILRGDQPIPAPGPEVEMRPGDYLVGSGHPGESSRSSSSFEPDSQKGAQFGRSHRAWSSYRRPGNPGTTRQSAGYPSDPALSAGRAGVRRRRVPSACHHRRIHRNRCRNRADPAVAEPWPRVLSPRARRHTQNACPRRVLDAALNFSPGLLAGLILGWGWLPAAVLGGVTYVSSSGVVAKLLHDLGRIGNRETPVVLSILVMEDLAMAVYLPMLAGLLIGGITLSGLGAAAAAIVGVVAFLAIAQRVEVGIGRLLFSHSDEALLLTILGLGVLVAGIAELVQVSAAVGALLVGIALSGPAAQGVRALLAPLRDFMAAIFFAFFGLSVDPSLIPGALGPALVLAAVTAATKYATGWWSARRAGIGPRGRARAGAALIARGEFSLVIAGIAVASGLETEVGALSIAYVLVLAVVGPVAARVSEPIAERLLSPQVSREGQP